MEYDDGVKKWYDMKTKTFSVVGDKEKITYKPRRTPVGGGGAAGAAEDVTPATIATTYGSGSGAGYNAYGYNNEWQRPWTPYVSTTAHARSEATFHVLVDPRACQTGDRLVLVGNLAEMGGWDDGVRMERHPRHACLWVGTVELPFTAADSCVFGMFQFSYKIVTSTGEELREGNPIRTEKDMQRYFFHAFQHNYTVARFRGWVSPTGKALVSPLLRLLVDEVAAGHLEAPGALNRFKFAVDGLAGADRSHVEDVFDEAVAEMAPGSGAMPDAIALLLTAMVGQFGATSNERIYTAGATYGTYVNGIYTPPATTITQKKPPLPRAWCRYLLRRSVDVPGWCNLRLGQLLGPHHRWAAQGVGECVERFSYHNSFEWVPLMPFAKKFFISPEVRGNCLTVATVPGATVLGQLRFLLVDCSFSKFVPDFLQSNLDSVLHVLLPCCRALQVYDNTHIASSSRDYLAVAEITVGLAQAQRQLAVVQRAQAEEEALAAKARGAGGGGGVAVDDAPKEPPAAVLARRLLSAVVEACPTAEDLSVIITGPLGGLAAAEPTPLVPVFASKVESLGWASAAAFDELDGLLVLLPCLRHPAVATALLKNKTPVHLNHRVLSFVAACLVESNAGSGGSGGSGGGGGDGSAEEAEAGRANELVGDYAELNTAAKDWIRRSHEDEPATLKASKEDDDDDDAASWNWTFYGHGNKGKKKTAKPKVVLTAAQVARLRADALSECCADVDRLLAAPFFGRNPRGVLFEMSRCWFLRGSPCQLLEAIATLASGSSGGLAALHPALGTHLAEEARKLARSGHSAAEVETLLAVVRAHLSPAMPLAHDLLEALARDATWPLDPVLDAAQPQLGSVLSHHAMWVAVRAWCRDGGVLTMDTGLTRLLGAVAALLASTSVEVDADAVPLATLSLLLGGVGGGARSLSAASPDPAAFLALVHAFGSANVAATRAQLASMAARKAAFDRRLERCQAFASFFCVSAGVKIDAVALRRLVDDVSTNYGKLLSCNIHTDRGGSSGSKGGASAAGGSGGGSGGAGVLDAVPVEVDWLFSLRSSELFLSLWRSRGLLVLRESVPGAVALLERRAGGASSAAEAVEDDDEDEAMPVPPEELQGDDGALEQFFEEHMAARQAATQARQAAREARQAAAFERADAEKRTVEELEAKVLSQAEVVSELLPRAQKDWAALALKTAMGSLPIADLDATFGKLPEGQIRDELGLLFATTSGGGGDGGGGTFGLSYDLESTLSKLQDYRLLRKLGRWLPSLLAAHEHLAGLCTSPLETDDFRSTMQAGLGLIKGSVDGANLGTVPALVEGVRGIFASYSPNQLDFMAVLGDAPALIEWLLEHANQQEFNQMLNVVRPCTDEPRMLSAIASLVFVRTTLLEPLYSHPPYPDLRALLDGFFAVKVLAQQDGEGSPLWHLNNIVSSFDALKDVFEKQTKSPSIKSCYDLREIMKHGRFVIRLGRSAAQALVVQMGSGTEHDAEYLLDLRSKLLMAEIPPELESEFGASAMIASFVAQLQVMSDTADALRTLYGTASFLIRFASSFFCTPQFSISGTKRCENEGGSPQPLRALCVCVCVCLFFFFLPNHRL